MCVKIERKENSLVELEITVGTEAFEKAVEAAYRKNAVKMNVPGFRRGKAPRKMIEKLYGSSVFYEDAVDIAFPPAYREALEEHDLDPVEKADVDVTSIDANGFTFIAKVHVRPEVTLEEYKGLKAVRPAVSVTEEDINAELERYLARNSRLEDSDQPLENGDTSIIDFEGFVDDVAFEGGKGENYKLVIGSGQFIQGFEEQLVGKRAGESCAVNVTFPEQYHAENLAGKPAVFNVTVKEAKRTIKPVLDDEFAQDVSEFDTLDELKESIKSKIAAERETGADEAFESAVIDELLKGFKSDIPDIMIEEQLSSILQDFSYRLSMQGLELSQYLQYTGQSFEDLQAVHRETAKRHVMCELAFHKIAVSEGFEVPQEEIDEEFTKLAERYKMDEKKIREAISEKSLKRDLLGLKGSKFLMENAVKLDAAAEDGGAPAAKEKKAKKKQNA